MGFSVAVDEAGIVRLASLEKQREQPLKVVTVSQYCSNPFNP
jgi:hypothetical protein